MDQIMDHVDDTLEALTKYKEILEREAANLGGLHAPLAAALGRQRLEEAGKVEALIAFFAGL